jgi:hypothetical protein
MTSFSTIAAPILTINNIPINTADWSYLKIDLSTWGAVSAANGINFQFYSSANNNTTTVTFDSILITNTNPYDARNADIIRLARLVNLPSASFYSISAGSTAITGQFNFGFTNPSVLANNPVTITFSNIYATNSNFQGIKLFLKYKIITSATSINLELQRTSGLVTTFTPTITVINTSIQLNTTDWVYLVVDLSSWSPIETNANGITMRFIPTTNSSVEVRFDNIIIGESGSNNMQDQVLSNLELSNMAFYRSRLYAISNTNNLLYYSGLFDNITSTTSDDINYWQSTSLSSFFTNMRDIKINNKQLLISGNGTSSLISTNYLPINIGAAPITSANFNDISDAKSIYVNGCTNMDWTGKNWLISGNSTASNVSLTTCRNVTTLVGNSAITAGLTSVNNSKSLLTNIYGFGTNNNISPFSLLPDKLILNTINSSAGGYGTGTPASNSRNLNISESHAVTSGVTNFTKTIRQKYNPYI